jgi:alkaline phosphatase
MKKFLALLVAMALLLTLFAGCGAPEEPDGGADEPAEEGYLLNGVPLEEYTIVYSATDPDYTKRAATYIFDEIKERTGLALTVKSDEAQAEVLAHEIVVGETNRSISAALDVKTEGFEFRMMGDDAHVAMEGDYFVIAAAAYYFVENYISDQPCAMTIDKQEAVYEPIVKQAENYIFLIGDGMGFNQTQLFDVFSAKELDMYSDGETAFYGYMFPYQGKARTDSLSGTTDSAASGTALATGYKTINGYVGKDRNLNDVPSLTELAISLDMATGVMSTETLTGATPAAFSAHAANRGDTEDILACQEALKKAHGTRIAGEYGPEYDTGTIINRVEKDLQNMLKALAKSEDGFFLMYEEAYFDKHSHSNELQNTFYAGLRFNQIIGCVMEFAFYHPETFVLITADHETGGLTKKADGSYYYTSTGHTGADVPVFAYGVGAEVFDGVTIENIQIPKTIAAMWGVELEGYDNENFPSLVSAK